MRNQRGSSLVDVLVAALVLTIALLSIGYAFQHSVSASSHVEGYNGALRVVQQVAEGLRVNESSATFTNNASSEIKDGNITYKVSVSSPVAVAGNTNLLSVDITVSWGTNSMTMTNYYYLKP